jgi:galactokinase
VNHQPAIDPASLRDALGDAYPRQAAALPRSAIVRAPGRVNLIGEHTDYNDGFVLPVAIDLEVRLAVSFTDERRARVTRLDDGTDAAIEFDPPPPPGAEWHDYIGGTAWSMTRSRLPLYGFDGVLSSTVPIGAGLSSSAALELASAWALSGPDGPRVSPLELARIAQRAENEYVGVPCGLMDQFASACGREGHALLLDCRSLEWRAVPLPDDLSLVVMHTGVSRSLGLSAYGERRADCETAVSLLAQDDPGVTSLRDVDMDRLESNRGRLPPRVYDRAQHVIAENDRVLMAVAALEAGDHGLLGELMAASHASLRDRYEVSCPELDTLVEIASSVPGVVGSRMTGAGFGGCTVTLVLPDAVEALRERVERDYPVRTGRTPTMWNLRSVDGAGFLPG